MAVTVKGDYTIPADPETVWINLNDPAVLMSCISGCQSFNKAGDTQFALVVKIKIGPLSTLVRVRFDLVDVTAPQGCRLVGEGEGGLAGFAKGTATIRLDTVPRGTLVTYAAEANLGGRVASFGGRWVDGVAKRITNQFFERFTMAIGAVPLPAR